MRLADYTTIRLGGPARGFVRASTEEELIEAVPAADASGEPVLILGGGSNLVVADEGFDALGAAGFPAAVQQQTVTDQSQNGLVLSQNPAANTQAKKGAPITIVVGKYVAPTPTTTTSTTTPTTPTTPTGTTSTPKKTT